MFHMKRPNRSKLAIVALAIALAASSGCSAMMYKPFAPGNALNRDGDLFGMQAHARAAALNECRQIAAGEAPAGARVAAGAILGAILGAALAHGAGLNGHETATIAAWGAADGAVQGVALTQAQQADFTAKCMNGKGY
jgi:hypothetical protein